MVGSFYDPELDEGCAFEELICFHGGIGGLQTRPFILHPAHLDVPPGPILGAASVHGILAGWRKALQAEQSVAAASHTDPATIAANGRLGVPRTAAMNLVWAFVIIAAAVAVAVTALLLVRRRAPEGGFFEDGDRAAGVFGVLATGFSVLLGFIVFLAFTSYDQSRTGAEQEALILVQQVENAQFFPPAGRRRADRRARLLRALGRQRRVGSGCAPARRETRSTRGG